MIAISLALPFAAALLCFALALRLHLRGPALVVPLPEAATPELQLLTTGGPSGSDISRQLAQAGFDHPNAARNFVYAKLLGGILGAILGLAMLRLIPALANVDEITRIGAIVVAAVLGYFIPVSVVDKRRAAWFRRIKLALPDALDFMLICVEAGQSVDVALKRVADELRPVHPDLSLRFVTLSEALAAGADRQEAWLKVAQETENDDLRQLATIITQSTSMGTPIAHTLRVFAADLRDQRVRQIEEKANVLPTKMTLGTMIFTIPPLLILLLAPALFRIASSF